MPLARYYNACGVLMQAGVPKAAELLVRSIGNDQDMFGFILLGAVQDSRTPTVTLGTKDLFIFGVYMAMALPIPQILMLIFPTIMPTYTNNMLMNGSYAGHRWYLLMVLEARALIAVYSSLRLYPSVQPTPANHAMLTQAKVGAPALCICIGRKYVS